ncbi:hypothetical protein O181_078481 [Austropuccinia psidii MF-1]|uniref:Reverse transcriptase RNase H-like domain-containing protein n=1 Tax=Austropuccinia psidii MF-1 TaxID=1389203 RepID=A0A9Q3ID35_9BASI|nr:hypothetical protein [Austropuccinia psidii MF-1]
MPKDTANKNLCKHTQDAQKFLVTPTKGMAYINGTATKMTVCIDNAQHPLIVDSGAHCSIVARNYLDHHFTNWEKQLLPTKAKNFKSASWKMTSIGTVIKEIIIPHRKGNIRLNPEFVVLEDAHIHGVLLGTDYQRMYGIDIYNSKNRHITIGTNKEKKFSLDIYQVSTHDPLEELLNGFREGQFRITLTSKQKLSLLKILRKDRPAFAIGEEPLGKIRGYDIELYLDVEIPYPPMLRRPPYPASLETRNQGLGAALHQRQIVDGEPREGVICYISRQLKDSEARYRATQTECLCLVWALGKLHYYLEGEVFQVYTDLTALKSLLNMQTTNRHILRWKITIQEYRGNMNIIYKEGKSHTNADGLSRCPLDNVKSNPAYEPEVAVKTPVQFMEVDRRKNFIFSEWTPESGTPDSGDTESEGTETPILVIHSSKLHNEFFSAVMKTYTKHKQCGILLQLLSQKYRSPELEPQLEEPWSRDYKDNKCFLIDVLLYHRQTHTSELTVVDRDHISLILQECHDCPYMGHMSEDRTKEMVARTAWWPKWEQELSE